MNLKKNVSGFTLIELLIVVAIIGVLSTIGIPTYQNMVMNAKKSEAKVGLGGLATIEAAFFAEYNVYGNEVIKMGYDVDGNAHLYTTGFSSATGTNAATYEPSTANCPNAYAMLNNSYPSYYTNQGATQVNRSFPGAGEADYVGAGTAGAVYNQTTNSTPTVGILAPNADSYVAAATGAIASGVAANGTVTPGCSSACQSVFIIDSNKALVELTEAHK